MWGVLGGDEGVGAMSGRKGKGGRGGREGEGRRRRRTLLVLLQRRFVFGRCQGWEKDGREGREKEGKEGTKTRMLGDDESWDQTGVKSKVVS